MKKINTIFVFALSLLFVNSHLSQVNTISSNSELKHVTIFNKGALVERTGLISVNKGANELVIENVSPILQNSSIQVVIYSDQVIINSVSKKMNYLGTNGLFNEETQDLKDSIDILKNKLRLENVNLSVFKEEKELLRDNKTVLKSSKEFIIDDLMDLTDYFRERMLDVENKLSSTRLEITELNKALKNVEQQLTIVNNNAENKYSNIVVQLTSLKDEDCQYEVSYNLNDAGWIPFYDIRTKKFNSPVDLTYKAKVYQKSNEDWNDVKLTLSTGNLNQSNAAPSFYTDYLSFYNNTLKKNTYRNKMEGSEAPNYSYDMEASASIEINDQEMSLSSAEFTSVNFSGTQVEYNIDLPYSIPSRRQPIFIDIQKVTLPATYDYYCYPSRDKDVFLMCHFKSLGSQNFLPGNGQVYYQGKSIGKTYVDPFSTKSTIDLSLGRDVSIIVERKLLKKFSSEVKIGDKVKLERSYELSVRNNKLNPIELKLIDQVPVSNNKGIDVELIEHSEANYNKQKGKLLWKLNLNSNETVQKSFSYTIKHPEDQKVRGIN